MLYGVLQSVWTQWFFRSLYRSFNQMTEKHSYTLARNNDTLNTLSREECFMYPLPTFRVLPNSIQLHLLSKNRIPLIINFLNSLSYHLAWSIPLIPSKVVTHFLLVISLIGKNLSEEILVILYDDTWFLAVHKLIITPNYFTCLLIWAHLILATILPQIFNSCTRLYFRSLKD